MAHTIARTGVHGCTGAAAPSCFPGKIKIIPEQLAQCYKMSCGEYLEDHYNMALVPFVLSRSHTHTETTMKNVCQNPRMKKCQQVAYTITFQVFFNSVLSASIRDRPDLCFREGYTEENRPATLHTLAECKEVLPFKHFPEGDSNFRIRTAKKNQNWQK